MRKDQEDVTKVRPSLSAAATATLFVLAISLPAQAQPQLMLFASGFDRPIAFVQDPSDPSVQMVVQQSGRVRVIKSGLVQPTDYLDLSTVVLAGGEQGLLGFAFAPDYVVSGRAFASFINLQGNSVLARFVRKAGSPLEAEPSSRFDFVWPDGNAFITQPFANHNGGNIVFGPDGYLYFGLGDGGSGDDPDHRAQNPSTLLGKMLRLNVSVPESDPQGYDIPADNPFAAAGDGVLDEIWDLGLRNPWRWSFDDPRRGGTGALVIGDVGQNSWEEIDYEPAHTGGVNYGWRNREGMHDHVMTLPPFPGPLTDPIYEYSHAFGCSVTGGEVYRGSGLGPTFFGRYFFGDFCTGRIWSLGLAIAPNGTATVANVQEHTSSLGVGNWSSFGTDAVGELYVVYYSGSVYRIVPGPAESAGIELTANGNFADGLTNWQTFATPDPAYLDSHVAGGVLRFRRVPAPGPVNQATVFQQTGMALAAGTAVTATFDLGNSSGDRKYMKVLIVGDPAFGDLASCAFWLGPHAPLRTYQMRTHSTMPWANASIYFYAASPQTDNGYYELDNVSLRYTPGVSLERTDCLDPLAPAPPGGQDGPDLVQNGSFDTGTPAPWTWFGTIQPRIPIAGGVFEFIRPTAAPPQGLVLQQTGQSLAQNEVLTATIALGNSSGVRKRALVIINDADFSDLAACSFWLAPGQPMLPYAMKLYTTKAWTSATVSVYAATIGFEPWTRLDNVTLRRTPSAATLGSECLEGGAAAAVTLGVVVDESDDAGASRGQTLGSDLGVRPGGQTRGSDPGVRPGSDPSAPNPTLPDGTWAATDDGWASVATDAGESVLAMEDAIDLTNAAAPRLTFDSWLSTLGSRAEVQTSLNGIDWVAVVTPPPSDTWQPVELDLTALAGERVFVRFVLHGTAPPPGAPPDIWRVRRLTIAIDHPSLP